MAQEVYKIRRMRAVVEPNGAHGVEIGGGSPNSFSDIQFREDTFKLTLNKPMEDPMLIQQHLFGQSEMVFMPRSWQLQAETNMRAAPARAGNATLMANVPDDPLLSVCFGGDFAGTGTSIASTSSTTVLNVANAAGLREGGAIACATGPGGALECRVIKTIAANVVTLRLALSSVPSNGSVVYAAKTYYLGATNGGNIRSLQLAAEGAPSVDRWLLRGGQIEATPKITAAPGTIGRLGWTLKGTEWNRADGTDVVAMNLAGAPVANQNYNSAGINSIMDSELRVQQLGVSTLAGTMIHAQQIEIVPNIAVGPHTTPAGQNTVFQWVPLRPKGSACTGNFAIPFESLAWKTLRDAKTQCGLTYQIGSSVSGGAVLLDVPRIAFNDWKLEEVAEISGQRMPFYAFLDNQTTGGGSTDLAVSPFRYHVF